MKLKVWISYFVLIGNLFAFLPFDEGGKEKWEGTMRDGFLRLNKKPVTEQISYLSDLLFALHGTYRSEQTEAIRDEATNLLLSIPGHAKYYQDQVDKMRLELLANSKKHPDELVRMQDEGHEIVDESMYLSETERAIRTLRFMPSAETVSVLGYFLNDPVGRDGNSLLGNTLKRGDSGPYLSNAELATDSIRVLGIEQPPFRDSKGEITPEEIDAWKDWWNEVKAGKRTYRFKGSKVEYGPDGPAASQANEYVERDQRRDKEREAGHRKSPIPPATLDSEKFSFAGILAACALIGAAIWYFLRGRKTA